MSQAVHASEAGAEVTHRPVIIAGLLLGLGMGGMFDGIVLHQLLQWHHMICEQSSCHPTSIADLQRKTFADGLFHAGCWVLIVLGLWRTSSSLASVTTRVHQSVTWGAIIAGWGVFNVVEGIVNHHILQLHHVRFSENQLLWDLAFLVWGAGMIVGGWAMIRRGGARRSASSL